MMKIGLFILTTALLFLAPHDAKAQDEPQGNRYYGSGNCSAVGECALEEFCGIDNQCYRYSCTNWYQYGPPEYTIGSYDDNVAEQQRNDRSELLCQNGPFDWHTAAIIYGCQGHIGAFSTPDEGLALGFTRQCRAQNVLVGKDFVCYEMAPDTDYGYFDTIVENAKMHDSIQCDNETRPHYIYQVYVESLVYGAAVWGLDSDEFNETLAKTAMYSYGEEVDDPDDTSGAWPPSFCLRSSLALLVVVTEVIISLL